MLKSLHRLLRHNDGSLPARAAVPAVPLRKQALPLASLRVGQSIIFSESCPLPQLRARTCPVRAVRTLRFGGEEVKNFQLSVDGNSQFSISIAEDADGHYLAFSRQLDDNEQDRWFGRDALSFFTEPSTAKTIRCKIDRVIEGAWAAERYVKTVDWVEGQQVGEGKGHFRYNLLTNDTGEKALEIEHFDTKNNIFVTVYRPVEDILTITETLHQVKPESSTSPEPEPLRKPDFRRISEEAATAEPIHIATTTPEPMPEIDTAPLPAFLLSQPAATPYLSLDEILGPEPERVRCSLVAAKALIDTSLQRGIRVRDVLRELVGLDSALSEEVIFEMPLSEKDYRMLSQRYKCRADDHAEIRRRLQDELRRKLLA